MIAARTEWNSSNQSELHATLLDALRRVVVTYWSMVQRALNIGNPRPHRTPSSPGDPPRKRTGWLQRHVQYEIDDASLTARVGVGQSAEYGLSLEAGTATMAARPFLLSTLEANAARLSAIAKGGR